MKIEEKGEKENKNKLRFDLITAESLTGMAEVLTYGANKYKPNSWQNVVSGDDEHYAALMRHLILYRKGEKLDKETKLSHLKHVLTNAMFLLYHEENDKKKKNTL